MSTSEERVAVRAREDFLRKREEASRTTRPSSNTSDPLLNLGNPFGTASNNNSPSHSSSSSSSSNSKNNNNNSMSQSRREDLLNQARQERDDFLDDKVVQASPEAQALRPIYENATPSTSTTSMAPPPYTTVITANNPPKNSPLNSKMAVTGPQTSTEESRASFLQTAQRLFSFLNHFSGDDVGPNGELKMPDFQPLSTSSSRSSEPISQASQTDSKRNGGGPPPKKQFNYKAFKEKIKNPHAGEAFKRIKGFVVNFNKTKNGNSILTDLPSRAESGNRMRTFFNEVERLMSVNELWCHDDVDEWDNTCEGLEKFVTSKLYDSIFCPRKEDKQRDLELEERIASLSFVSFQHLDISGPEIKNEYLLTWKLAQDELSKMNDYKAPRDKMICLLNACKVIVRLLTEAATDAGDSPPGADQFLPALIYVVLKANPPNLFSNLDYIDRFRNPKKMLSEPGYWYTNLYSAVTFLENVQHDSLTISEEEFAIGMRDAKLQMAEAKEMARTSILEAEEREVKEKQTEQSALEDVFNKSNSHDNTGQIEGKLFGGGTNNRCNDNNGNNFRAKKVLLKAKQWTSSPPLQPNGQTVVTWKAHRYRYLSRQLSEVNVTEVGSLLNEYKYLCSTTEQLLKERNEMLKRIQELEGEK